MCDLIDLNSPSTKDLAVAKLASPLIPVPADSPCGLQASKVEEAYPGGTGKRESLENNPFDMVLHKTTEYIQKKNDPFEVMLERALRPKGKRSAPIRTGSMDLADGFTPKHKKYMRSGKLNRTLDESLINESLRKEKPVVQKALNESLITNLSDMSITDDCNIANDRNVSTVQDKVPVIAVQSMDLTILDQSALNDTLSDVIYESGKAKCTLPQKVSVISRKDDIVPKQIMLPDMELKVPKLRRSHSQGENLVLRKAKQLNQTSQSVLDMLRAASLRGNSTGSSISSGNTDVLNEGFLKSRYSESSVFSSLSNISAISKLSSVLSTNNLSVALSNRTINRTFLESCSSDNVDSMKTEEQTNTKETTTSSICVDSINSVDLSSNGNAKARISTSDLTDRLNKLRVNSCVHNHSQNSNSNKASFTLNSNIQKDSVNVPEKKQPDADNKLIDIDVFTPDQKSSKECSKSSISDTSSDSVFIEGNSKINKSILREAKALARTFEEMAQQTSSGSSFDDLINSNPSWTSELLPAFDDEDVVGNLIELPVSPNTNNDRDANNAQNTEQASFKNKDSSSDKKQSDFKDLEAALCPESTATENKVVAATLLYDLKKLIEAEKNKEAGTLLEDLEKVLGVECKNNTELLNTYLNTTNNLAKSPQKSNGSMDIVKNVEEHSMEKSQEENFQVEPERSAAERKLKTDTNINSSNIMEHCNNNKEYLKQLDDREMKTLGENVDTTPPNSIVGLNRSSKENGSHLNSDTLQDSSNSIYKKSCDTLNSSNEKVATELLTNLGKLLNGQVEEQITTNILKNLGKVLNIASNHYAESKSKTDNAYPEIQPTPKKSNVKSEKKTRTSVLSKSTTRLSLDLEPKSKPASNVLRRSISVSHSPPIKKVPTPVIPKNKNTSHVRDAKKRFPSDPGIVDVNKKGRISDANAGKVFDIQNGRRSKLPGTLEKEKRSVIPDTVKNKLKKKPDADVVNKKGPMKALLPIGNMQKRESFSKKTVPAAGTVTPPKTHKIISSTPNTTDSEYKKSPRSKPVASSTPDAQNSKMRKVVAPSSGSLKKRNFSCDISPVVTHTADNGVQESPKRANKMASPKRLTPKRGPANSNIPKLPTSPAIRNANASFDSKTHAHLESPKRSVTNGTSLRKTPLTPTKVIADKTQHSPLRDSNKLGAKVKPFNLITKLRRHSQGGNAVEKENNYV